MKKRDYKLKAILNTHLFRKMPLKQWRMLLIVGVFLWTGVVGISYSLAATTHVDCQSGTPDGSNGFYKTISEWVCIEHGGYAGQKAYLWWTLRSHEPMPRTVEDALALADDGAIGTPRAITVRQIGKYERIVGYKLGEKPALVERKDVIPF